MQICDTKDEEIAVFGDDLKDLSMFMPEWTCIAMCRPHRRGIIYGSYFSASRSIL